MTTTIIAFLTLCICSPSYVSARRVALVIGNGAYQEGRLKNSVNDAHDMTQALLRLGFEVISIRDANLRNMYKALDAFSFGLSKKDVALFFYAGHGVQIEGENYLLPIDHQIRSAGDVRYESFPVGRLVGRLEDAQTTNIIILDACRNNPLGRSFGRSLDRGMAVFQRKPEGTFIAYATAPGKTAADGDGDNGLFTSALLKHMETEDVDISAVLRKVRKDVKDMSFGKQVPWSESSLTGAFYFKEQSTKILTSTTQKTLSAPQSTNYSSDKKFEGMFWESIKDSKNSSLYEAYLQKFPNGLFKSIALDRIARYSKPKIDPVGHKKVTIDFISLRSKPKIINKANLIGLIRSHNFFDSDRNISGSFNNSFIDNGDNTITDSTTGLMWQKGGSRTSMFYYDKQSFINKLNRVNFAGYLNWRLPTIEELASLLQNNPRGDNFINDIFGIRHQPRVWSSDLPNSAHFDSYGTGYVLNIKSGTFVHAVFLTEYSSGGSYEMSSNWSGSNDENWVKAVRSINRKK